MIIPRLELGTAETEAFFSQDCQMKISVRVSLSVLLYAGSNIHTSRGQYHEQSPIKYAVSIACANISLII